MLIAVLLLSACTAAGRSGTLAQETISPQSLPFGVAEREFAQCPGADALSRAANVSWEPQSSRLDRHRALRARLNSAVPEGATRILLWSSGKHHTSVSLSIIAVRDARGEWRTSGVGEEGPGLLPIEPRPMDVLDRNLTPEEGRALDQALEDPCLYASPRFQRNPDIASGGAFQTIEIESPGRRWVASWFGARTPQIEAVVNLIAN